MPDWGLKISDAAGNLHDLAKNAFDSLSVDARAPLNVTEKILKQNFSSTFDALKAKAMKSLGLDLSGDLTVENMSSLVMEKVLEAGGKLAGEIIISGLGTAMADVEGPIGMLLSEAASLAIGAFESEPEHEIYKPGQWVLIDNGSRSRVINQKRTTVQIEKRTSLWGDDYYEIPGEMDFEETTHSVGFVLGSENNDYLWSVFEFSTGREKVFSDDKLRPAPRSLAQQLDDNPEFSLIREIRFMKDHDPTLKSYLPTDIGSRVYFKGERNSVIQCKGKEYVIENDQGIRRAVNAAELKAGTTLTSSSWNRAKIDSNSFTSLSPDSLFSGEWVWIPAGKTFVDALSYNSKRRLAQAATIGEQLAPEGKILGLLTQINGKRVSVVRAYDGRKVAYTQDEIVPASAGVQSALNSQRDSSLFKDSVLNGHDPTVLPLGETMPAITLGRGESDLLIPATAGMAPFMTKAEEDSGLTFVRTIGMTGAAVGQMNMKLNQEDEDIAQYNKDYVDNVTYQVGKVQNAGDSSSGVGMGALLVLGLVAYVAFASS